jgi:cytochrome P450
MESLRICHPLSQLVKTTNSKPQSIKINGTLYTIPAGAAIHCSLPALHTHPKYWGANSMNWNPGRFIETSKNDGKEPKAIYENETLAADTSEHFMPFAWGQRVCPGKKFAQVELVAALAIFFKKWRVKPDIKIGETEAKARQRVWNASLIVDHEGHMLHEIVDPESIALEWFEGGP